MMGRVEREGAKSEDAKEKKEKHKKRNGKTMKCLRGVEVVMQASKDWHHE